MELYQLAALFVLYIAYLRRLKSSSPDNTLSPLHAVVAYVVAVAVGKLALRQYSALQLGDVYAIVTSSKDPTSLQGAATIATELRTISLSFPYSVLFLLLLLFTLMQTFCLPGTIVINVVCGTLYGVQTALPLCVAAGTLGACSCYTLSRIVGRPLATAADKALAGGKGIAKFQAKIEENRDNLFCFFVFLRISPLLPNWLINLASPVIGVPLKTFALATAVGIAPQTFIAVRIGAFLVDVSSVPEGGRIIGINEWLSLVAVALIVLMPMGIKKYMSR